MTARTVTADELNAVAEFDLPFRVLADGRVDDDLPDVFAPEAYTDLDADGNETDGAEARWELDLEHAGWEAVRGYSGQQGYSGAHMHPSEYLGGGMARDVLATPGVYVVVAVNGLRDLEDDDYTDEARDQDYAYAWALLRRRDAS